MLSRFVPSYFLTVTIKKNYSKFEVKEEFGTLSFNNVLLYREDTKMYQVIF